MAHDVWHAGGLGSSAQWALSLVGIAPDSDNRNAMLIVKEEPMVCMAPARPDKLMSGGHGYVVAARLCVTVLLMDALFPVQVRNITVPQLRLTWEVCGHEARAATRLLYELCGGTTALVAGRMMG
jgi:hypothetical protein